MRKVTKEIEKLVENLESRSNKLEKDCEVQTVRKAQVTEDLGQARMRIERLERRLERMEGKYRELKLEKEGRLFCQADVEAGRLEGAKGRDPLSVFPEAVWTKVFGCLKDPKDLKNCYDACTSFQRILQPERTTFLILDVIRILANHDPAFDRSTANRPTSVLKTCRLVSQAWRQSVDRFFLEECPFFPVTSFVEAPMDSLNGHALVFKHENNPWTNQVIRNTSSSANPVPFGYLSYDDRNLNSIKKRQLQNSFVTFLKKFGHRVRFLEVHTGDKSYSISWYPFLISCLDHMPNLEALKLNSPMGAYWAYDGCKCDLKAYREYYNIRESDMDCDCYSTQVDNRLQPLREEASRTRFPTIKTLTSIYFSDCPVVMESILKANPQIDRLRVEGQVEEYRLLQDPTQLKLDNLREFWSDDDDLSFGAGIPTLRKLSLDGSGRRSGIDCSYLFESLGKSFGGSGLVELSLNLNGNDTRRSSTPTLKLPNLKKLNLSIHHLQYSIDFILPLVKLELLTLAIDLTQNSYDNSKGEWVYWIDIEDRTKIPETVRFHQVDYKLRKSNIWQLLPKLQKTRVRVVRPPVADIEGGGEAGGRTGWVTCTRNQIKYWT